jgi:hypothetical protein
VDGHTGGSEDTSETNAAANRALNAASFGNDDVIDVRPSIE